MQIFLNIIFSYLLGSISGSMVLGKIKGIDIREMGSGNAGGTNAFRTVGPLFAIGVVIIDILKGYVAVQCISGFDFWNIYDSNNIPLMKITCGVGAVLGHVYPIYYSFKGGKGAGTLIGIVAALLPIQCLLYSVSAWIIILLLTGFVGLGTMIAGAVLSITSYIYVNEPSMHIEYFYFSLSMTLFILFTHRSNIVRMIQGEENQFKKIMLFKKVFRK